jgi:hypothetical protein
MRAQYDDATKSFNTTELTTAINKNGGLNCSIFRELYEMCKERKHMGAYYTDFLSLNQIAMPEHPTIESYVNAFKNEMKAADVSTKDIILHYLTDMSKRFMNDIITLDVSGIPVVLIEPRDCADLAPFSFKTGRSTRIRLPTEEHAAIFRGPLYFICRELIRRGFSLHVVTIPIGGDSAQYAPFLYAYIYNFSISFQ